jgi:hypothetical protein
MFTANVERVVCTHRYIHRPPKRPPCARRCQMAHEAGGMRGGWVGGLSTCEYMDMATTVAVCGGGQPEWCAYTGRGWVIHTQSK